MAVLYGIKNCDTVKKARVWLDKQQIEYQFHDFRVDGLDANLLQRFIDELGLDAVLNQRSSSWRNLSEEQRLNLSPDKAFQLLLAIPTLIKRPILDIDEKLIVGFSTDFYHHS